MSDETKTEVVDTKNGTGAILSERDNGGKLIVFIGTREGDRIFKLWPDGTWEEIE